MVIDENVAHEIIGEIRFEASRMKKLSSVAHGLPAEFVDTRKYSALYSLHCTLVGIK